MTGQKKVGEKCAHYMYNLNLGLHSWKQEVIFEFCSLELWPGKVYIKEREKEKKEKKPKIYQNFIPDLLQHQDSHIHEIVGWYNVRPWYTFIKAWGLQQKGSLSSNLVPLIKETNNVFNVHFFSFLLSLLVVAVLKDFSVFIKGSLYSPFYRLPVCH